MFLWCGQRQTAYGVMVGSGGQTACDFMLRSGADEPIRSVDEMKTQFFFIQRIKMYFSVEG